MAFDPTTSDHVRRIGEHDEILNLRRDAGDGQVRSAKQCFGRRRAGQYGRAKLHATSPDWIGVNRMIQIPR
ncbi:hypothetical protein DIE14_34810 [Burkholderia sp. Bp9017]|uniref:hypothetical protein n=1 Tax=Burkholderia TaxID=32008 RepID=UPI000F5E30AA|nr:MULTISPECIES: hypothetical protein [Burkholderia]MBY4871314.1 hypothetical protein [Burkholderia anthina]RQZ13918.1 hypothetical protein DIE14_34810 [Burkholderia sp. Bp9017]